MSQIAIDNGLYLLEKCTEIHNTCNKLTNENAQLRNELEQTIISSKKLSKEVKQLLTDVKNVSNLEWQIAFDKQHTQSLTTELERLKSQYLGIQSIGIASVEIVRRANLITSKKETLVLSSKSFELQVLKTKCGVFKQHLADTVEQSLMKKYQLLPEKQNNEMLGGGITELTHKLLLLIRSIYYKGKYNYFSDAVWGNNPIKKCDSFSVQETSPRTYTPPLDKN
ncbi:hypothetical protein RhiirA5_417865 [Rhizophagus irregularis]|uniref:Uncharacterized protein n=1 Tax=Rhizophagus irregularis TaxID=588596 RepID=A0A2N0PLP4_9GLOM|nr:hypothetical protein RhiirA5_417865 [Rhizophagus irregularis]